MISDGSAAGPKNMFPFFEAIRLQTEENKKRSPRQDQALILIKSAIKSPPHNERAEQNEFALQV